MEHFDFIALGGGNAGLSASKAVRAADRKVAVIDPAPIGGLCSLRGCNPKKVLVRATEVLQLVRQAGEHGIGTGAVTLDWNAVIDRKHRFTDPVTASTEQGLARAGIEYIKARARFVAPDRVEADGRTLSFDGLVVATGSLPRRLSFPGAKHVGTSDRLLEQRTVPARLAIIGGGVVAFEFAHIFARAGSTVHVLIRGHGVLQGHDRDLASRLVKHLESLGVAFHQGVEVKAVEAKHTSYDVQLSDERTLMADFILNAAGRPADLEGLGLEQAHVEYSEHGVKVNEHLRSTTNPRVFAAGDAHGARELSPVASYEGAIVAHNFLHGNERRADYSAIPSAIFTVPPYAALGLSEEQARKQGLDVEVVTQDMGEWIVFRIAGEEPSHGKVIYEKSSGRVLGAHLFGPGADDNIHVFAMAMRYGITRDRLAEMIYVYPALGSALGHMT